MLLSRRDFRGLRPAADAELRVGVPAIVVAAAAHKVPAMADVLGGEAVLVDIAAPGAVDQDAPLVGHGVLVVRSRQGFVALRAVPIDRPVLHAPRARSTQALQAGRGESELV